MQNSALKNCNGVSKQTAQNYPSENGKFCARNVQNVREIVVGRHTFSSFKCMYKMYFNVLQDFFWLAALIEFTRAVDTVDISHSEIILCLDLNLPVIAFTQSGCYILAR